MSRRVTARDLGPGALDFQRPSPDFRGMATPVLGVPNEYCAAAMAEVRPASVPGKQATCLGLARTAVQVGLFRIS